MSTASKVTFLTTLVGTAGIVAFVHWAQTAEKAVSHAAFHFRQGIVQLTYMSQAMHAGVVRDMEHQRIKRERQADFEMQRQLELEYKKTQNVHDSTTGA